MNWSRVIAAVLFAAGMLISFTQVGRWETIAIVLMIFGMSIFAVGIRRTIKGDDQM